MQALLCMLAYFTTYWYYGIPVSALAFTGDVYFQDGAPPLAIGGQVLSSQQQVSGGMPQFAQPVC